MVACTPITGQNSHERARAAVASGEYRLSATVRTLLSVSSFRAAVIDETATEDLVHYIYQGEHSYEAPLYARYVPMLEALGRRYGTSPAYGPDDAHQDGAIELLEMARDGAADFTRRVKFTVRYRVSRYAHEHSRAVTGMNRDQVQTVRDALDNADGDREAAWHRVAQHPDLNRRMRRSTFTALVERVLPVSRSLDASDSHDRTLLDFVPEPSGWPGDDDTAEYVRSLLKHPSLTDREQGILVRAHGLAGFSLHSDVDLGKVYGVDSSVVGKVRRRALDKLWHVVKEVA